MMRTRGLGFDDTHNLTTKAREALSDAGGLMMNRRNPEIGPVHPLAALLQETDGLMPRLLSRTATRVDQLQAAVEDRLAAEPVLETPSTPGGIDPIGGCGDRGGDG